MKPRDSLPPPPNDMPPPPPNEIPPLPCRRLNPTYVEGPIPPLPVPASPTEAVQLDEPASLGAGGRHGRARPTRRRGSVVGGGCVEVVPMEKPGNEARPVRPRGGRGGTAPGGGDLGWKATRESPRRPRGGGRRSDPLAPGCGGAIGVRWRREAEGPVRVPPYELLYKENTSAGRIGGRFSSQRNFRLDFGSGEDRRQVLISRNFHGN